MKRLLEVHNITKKFGGLIAVNGFSMDMSDDEMLGLIGPNGAGKTTVLNLISGFLKPNSGDIFFAEQRITNDKPSKKGHKGIVRTFQANNVFKQMTVWENILIGLYNRTDFGFWRPIIPFLERKNNSAIIKEASQIMELMSLMPFQDTMAGSLPHGFQRLLGIGIALTAHPRLLLLDEPFTGMITEEVQLLSSIVKKIRAKKISIVMVEHNMRAVMELCDRIIVLNFGNKIAEGLPDDIQNNPEVIEAYLGTDQGEIE